mmetsp:Transcript_18331/g.46924  ORF Transcript_18331/g.46924 Transcript_18331/m.46924 type:complete len:318 (+) Transcript_18331:133-1086(+)
MLQAHVSSASILVQRVGGREDATQLKEVWQYLLPVGSVGTPLAASRRDRRRGSAPLGARDWRSGAPLASGRDGRSRCVPVGGRRRDIDLDGRLAGSRLVLGLLLHLLRVAVEEKVNHDIPRLHAVDGAAEAEDLTREHPVKQADRVLAFVVGRDGHVDVLERRVRVAEGDGRDVSVRRLSNGLVVSARVGQEQQARLHELVGDLVGESTGGEAAGNRRRARVLAVLQDRALAVGARRDHAHVRRVLNSDDHTRSEHELVVGTAEVNDVDAIRLALPHVTRHLSIQVLGAKVRRARQHHLEVLLLLLLGDTRHHDHSC